MADSWILTNAAGSSADLGTYTRADPGPDFGAKDLIKAQFAQNPAAEGGALGFESVGVRRFTFPLLLASSSFVPAGLPGLEGYLRELARPGAYIDLKPEGVATADMPRFDVLTGRLEEEYSVYLQRSPRRNANLHLDVQPYGYSPSLLILASAASIGLPGRLTWNPASVLGDAPALAELIVSPTTVGTAYPAGSWLADAMLWSFGGNASFRAHWPAASITSPITASLAGDKYAAGSQALVLAGFTPSVWGVLAHATIAAALEPAYRSHYRAWTWTKHTPSQHTVFQLTLDAVAQAGAAMASFQPVATAVPAVASGAPGFFGAQPSPAYQLVDLGELSLPPVGSGMPQNVLLRLWGYPAGDFVATPQIHIGGLYLQPLDAPAGILARGLMQPSTLTPSTGRFLADAITQRALITAPTGNIGSHYPVADTPHYRGLLPILGASSEELNILYGARSTASGATGPLIHSAPAYAAASVRYRPRWAFLKSV